MHGSTAFGLRLLEDWLPVDGVPLNALVRLGGRGTCVGVLVLRAALIGLRSTIYREEGGLLESSASCVEEGVWGGVCPWHIAFGYQSSGGIWVRWMGLALRVGST